jgi:hypothetical protein
MSSPTESATLVQRFLDLSESRYSIEWSAIQASVIQRLRPVSVQFWNELSPVRYPTYWCVPVVVGDYLGASRAAVVDDLEPFVSGCLVRHFFFELECPFHIGSGDDVVQLVTSAYSGCRTAGSHHKSLDDWFAAKCRPWMLLLTLGTCSIHDEARDRSEYHLAMRAVVLVYSCLQIIDDWHDRGEDADRGHWNMWADEAVPRVLAMIGPLVAAARQSVERLRPHLLRRALVAQLADAVLDLTELVNSFLRNGLHVKEALCRVDDVPLEAGLDASLAAAVLFLGQRLGAEVPGLWCDFALEGISPGSTECISAYVASQLSAAPLALPRARAVAATLLAAARKSGGWGYRADVPADCDSTAWVLLAAIAAGVNLPTDLVNRSQHFIIDHQADDGGFVTYRPEARAFLTPSDQAGWFEPEVSVTASAILGLCGTGYPDVTRLEQACKFIALQQAGGLWSSYWWRGFGYGTFMAASALRGVGGDRWATQLEATQRAIIAGFHDDGSWGGDRDRGPFATSLALQTLLLSPSEPDGAIVRSAASYLRGMQLSSGGWAPNAQMLAPGGRGGRDLLLRDSGMVTTATVIGALQAVRVGLSR